MSINIRNLMDIVSARTESFLNDDLNIKVAQIDTQLAENNRLQLQHITSVVTLGSSPPVFVIFSFEQNLMDKIFEAYTKELDILPEERLEYMEETAGDVVNMMVGNSISELYSHGQVISLSPPIVINKAENIAKSKTVKFYVSDLYTVHGSMKIFCIGPNELFEI